MLSIIIVAQKHTDNMFDIALRHERHRGHGEDVDRRSHRGLAAHTLTHRGREVQKAEGREKIDWQRNGAFTAFGFAYLGIIQCGWGKIVGLQ